MKIINLEGNNKVILGDNVNYNEASIMFRGGAEISYFLKITLI